MDRPLLYFCTVQESHARHTRPISGLDCIRVLHRLGFRIIHRARDLVLMERGRTEPKIARVPRTTSLPEDVLAEILSRAGLCLPLFLELLDKPTKICGCCGYPYSRKAWNTLQRVGRMRDDGGKSFDLRRCAKCFSSMVNRPTGK